MGQDCIQQQATASVSDAPEERRKEVSSSSVGVGDVSKVEAAR